MEYYNLFKIEGSSTPVTDYEPEPGDTGMLSYDDFEVRYRVLENYTMVVKVVTSNKDLNNFIGDDWHTNARTFPSIGFCINKNMNGSRLYASISVSDGYYSMHMNGHFIESNVISSFSNRLLELFCVHKYNNSTIYHTFHYNEMEFEIRYNLKGDAMYRVIFFYNNHMLLELSTPLLHYQPIDLNIVIGSFTDILGKYLSPEYLSDGYVIERHVVTNHELMIIRKQIYELIMQRHEPMIKKASN